MSASGWYGVDLDGTLAHYTSGHGVETIGEPIGRMVEFVKGLIKDGYEVRIMTARVWVDGTQDGIAHALHQKMMIQNWCEKHLGKRLAVTNQKDYHMIALYDDRAYHVIPNTGKIVGL